MQTKPFKQYSTLVCAAALTFFTIFLSSCGGDDPAPAPVADFTYVVDVATGLKVTFTNTSQNGVSYAWNFGVTGATSTVESPEYTYASSGAYTVVLTATNVDGVTATKSKTVAITAIPQNVLLNNEFTDNSAWIIHDSPDQASEQGGDFTYETQFTFADGKVSFGGNVLSPDGVSPSRLLGSFYQAVELEIGTYELSTSYFTNAGGWMYIQILSEAPVAATAVEEGGDGAIPLLFLDFDGDCPDELTDYNLVDFGCRYTNDNDDSDTNGVAEIAEAGTYYFVVTTGEWEQPAGYGTTGFNSISLRKFFNSYNFDILFWVCQNFFNNLNLND